MLSFLAVELRDAAVLVAVSVRSGEAACRAGPGGGGPAPAPWRRALAASAALQGGHRIARPCRRRRSPRDAPTGYTTAQGGTRSSSPSSLGCSQRRDRPPGCLPVSGKSSRGGWTGCLRTPTRAPGPCCGGRRRPRSPVPVTGCRFGHRSRCRRARRGGRGWRGVRRTHVGQGVVHPHARARHRARAGGRPAAPAAPRSSGPRVGRHHRRPTCAPRAGSPLVPGCAPGLAGRRRNCRHRGRRRGRGLGRPRHGGPLVDAGSGDARRKRRRR